MEWQTCTRCDKEKPIEAFSKKREWVDTRCKKCRNTLLKRWHLKNPDYKRRSSLKNKFGITLEKYNEIFLSQKGCCRICGRHQSTQKKALAVDHNHESGEIRALLCQNCNVGLGNFQDSVEILEKAIEYKMHLLHTGIKIPEEKQ